MVGGLVGGQGIDEATVMGESSSSVVDCKSESELRAKNPYRSRSARILPTS